MIETGVLCWNEQGGLQVTPLNSKANELQTILEFNSNSDWQKKFFLIGLRNRQTVCWDCDATELKPDTVLTTSCGANDSISPALTVQEFVDCYYTSKGISKNTTKPYVAEFLAILRNLNVKYFNGTVNHSTFSVYPESAKKEHEPVISTWETVFHDGKKVSSNLYHGRITPGSGYAVESDKEKEERIAREEKKTGEPYKKTLREIQIENWQIN